MNINAAKELLEQIYAHSRDVDADMNDLDLSCVPSILEPSDEPRHGAFVVCYVYPDGIDADYEAFDTEKEAMERYEALVGFEYSSVTIAKPVRSTDYDCN